MAIVLRTLDVLEHQQPGQRRYVGPDGPRLGVDGQVDFRSVGPGVERVHSADVRRHDAEDPGGPGDGDTQERSLVAGRADKDIGGGSAGGSLGNADSHDERGVEQDRVGRESDVGASRDVGQRAGGGDDLNEIEAARGVTGAGEDQPALKQAGA